MISTMRFIICVVILIHCVQYCLMSTDKMSVKGPYIVDKCGRVRIFHGINGVLKYFPWYPYKAPDPPMLDSNYLKNLSDWGFNVVRLGAMWAGTEPQEGQYNETYLSIMKTIVELANNHSIYIFLDMHQDLLTSALKGLDYLTGYDGIPLWLYRKFPTCVNNTPLNCATVSAQPTCVSFPCPVPSGSDGNGAFFVDYFTSVCSNAFQQFYQNNSGSIDSWSKFWVKIAQTFGSYSNLLGYELINEPWFGDIYKNPSLLSPGIAGSTNLLPAYTQVNQAIRTVDNQTLLFYEPVTYGVIAPGQILGTGFSTVPGNNSYANLSVLSYHWYCTSLSVIPPTLTSAQSARASCNPQGDLIFQTVKNDIQRTGGSSFLTEFGFNPDDESGAQQNYFVMDKCDQYFQSWTVWGMSFLDDSGNVVYDDLSQFNRPYAYAIAGTPQLMFYDHNNTHCFTLKYNIDLTINCPSLIYLPNAIYPRPNGYTITLTCGLQSSVDVDDANLIDIYTTNSTTNGCLGIVNICPS